jgi:cytochrome bd-type quinol oxidase subunit 2
MVSSALFSLLLLTLSAALLVMHRRSWLAVRDSAKVQEREKRYALAQYRRRMQASGMIAVVGIAIGMGPLVPQRPGPYTFYLGVLLVACLGLVLLAGLDVWATRQHYRRLRSEQVAAQIKLALEYQSTGDSSDTDAVGTAHQ